MKTLAFLLTILLTSFSCSYKEQRIAQKPNVIYILADDLGYGDLSCYCQTKFTTPNIDRLAKDGMKFTQHYSGSTVCAPSRSTLMTGLHTGHTPIRGNKELEGEGQTPLPADSYTIAELFKEAGYITGAFGKWGLGNPGSEGDPNMQGFDTFYGYNCQRIAHRYYPTYLWDNQEKDYLEGNDWISKTTYAPDIIQEKTLDFIEKNRRNPFFVYVPFVQPHAELIVPNDSVLAKFDGKYIENKPYIAPSGGDYGSGLEISKYCSQETPRAVFAAMVSRIDIYVGQIIEKLEELGIAENTIIMFASDNGPHVEGGADPVFFNSAGGLRGVKRDLYEGGIRTPFIVKWPKKIEAGTISNHISAFWDVLPTCAEIVGINPGLKNDGISFLPELTGEGKQETHKYLYWEYNSKGGRKAIRMGKWKAVLNNINSGEIKKLELYDIEKDIAESRNVANEHPEIIEEIEQLLVDAHEDSDLFPFKRVNSK